MLLVRSQYSSYLLRVLVRTVHVVASRNDDRDLETREGRKARF